MQGFIRRVALVTCAAVVLVAGASAGAVAAEPLRADTPVARIGDVTIDYGTLERWRLTGMMGNPRKVKRTDVLHLLLDYHRDVLEVERRGLRPRPVAGTLPPAHLRALRRAGMRSSDTRLLRRATAAHFALSELWGMNVPSPSEAELLRAWRRKRDEGYFTQPERFAEVLELPTAADADAALAAVRAGESFSAVGARLAPPRESAFRGSVQLFTPLDWFRFSGAGIETEEGPATVLPPALERALFGAAVGELVGPIVTSRAVFVVRVTQIVSERERLPLAQVRQPLQTELTLDQVMRAAKRQMDRQRRRWRARTVCDRRFAADAVCGKAVAEVGR